MKTWHKIIIGDSRRMKNIPDESVHLVITSPPYPEVTENRQTPNGRPAGSTRRSLISGSSKFGIFRGLQPDTIQLHSHWNWPLGWCGCFPSQVIPSWTHFVALGQQWWRPFETAETVSESKLILNIAGWLPHI
jgi:hypothetical protein